MNIRIIKQQLINLKLKNINREYLEELFYLEESVKTMIEKSKTFKEKYIIYSEIKDYLDISRVFEKEILYELVECENNIKNIKYQMENWVSYEDLEKKLEYWENKII